LSARVSALAAVGAAIIVNSASKAASHMGQTFAFHCRPSSSRSILFKSKGPVGCRLSPDLTNGYDFTHIRISNPMVNHRLLKANYANTMAISCRKTYTGLLGKSLV
jgi:hypothetical protein